MRNGPTSWLAPIVLAFVLAAGYIAAERRYEPAAFVEEVIGFYVLPVEMITGRRDLQPKAIKLAKEVLPVSIYNPFEAELRRRERRLKISCPSETQ